jgi:hypothetical protein
MMIFSPVQFRGFILDVKRLQDFAGLDSLFGVDVYNGHLVRFVKASVNSIVIDFNYNHV